MNGLEGFDTLMRKHPVWPMEQTIPREYLPGQGGEASIFQGPVSTLDPLGGLFGGTGAATHSPGMLKEARRLMKLLKGTAKKVSEKVRKKTGWFKGLDDKWRFEIDDSKMKVVSRENIKSWGTRKDMEAGNSTTALLPEIAKHSELYDSYPELKNMSVLLVPDKQGAAFVKSKEGWADYIEVGYDRKTGEIHAEDLVHEIQHGIQETEGFARGGNPQEMAKVHSNILVDLNKQVAEINIQLTDAVGTPMYNELLELRQGIVTEIQKIEGPEGIGVLDKGFADYKRLAGEIESRDAASRMDFGPLQRTETRPDIDRTDAIVQYGLRGEAGQVGPVKTPNENLRGKLPAKAPHEMTQAEFLKKEPLPPMGKIPEKGQFPAVETDDGSIYVDLKPEQSTHILFIKKMGIPPERLKSGGWIKDGVYEPSIRSDTSRYADQMKAKARVEHVRAVDKALAAGIEVDPKVLRAYPQINFGN